MKSSSPLSNHQYSFSPHGRKITQHHINAMRKAETFTGLPHDVSRFDLIRLLKSCRHLLGFTTIMVQHLEDLIKYTKEDDWHGNNPKPFVFIAVDDGKRDVNLLYGKQSDDDSQEDRINLEGLTNNVSGTVIEGTAKQEYTKPPPRYSMKALLQDLTRVARYVTDPKIKKLLLDKDSDKGDEAGGIGTPATRDSHIETLFVREFLIEQGNHIVSTDLGRQFHDALPDFVVKPDMTALWHEKQKQIEAGNLDYQQLINEVDATVPTK